MVKQYIIVHEQKLDLVGKFGDAELLDLVTCQLSLQMQLVQETVFKQE